MFNSIYSPQQRQPVLSKDGLWTRPFAFVKQQFSVQGQLRTRFCYVNSEVNEFSQLLRMRSTDYLGKTDFDLFEEFFAAQYLEEDCRAFDRNSMGIIFDNPLPLPCIYHCTTCMTIGSKIHLPFHDGSFIFAVVTLVQCSAPQKYVQCYTSP